LEDGIFTDRHGVQHDLNGYMIVFTSNMSQEQYKKHIPDSLKSRFDMIYYFEDLPDQDKRNFIYETADKLRERLFQQFSVSISIDRIKTDLEKLVTHSNLRYIKRRIEDIVFNEFFNNADKFQPQNLGVRGSFCNFTF
jgi:MoxR-like ATPase